jgi:hypothetical protein
MSPSASATMAASNAAPQAPHPTLVADRSAHQAWLLHKCQPPPLYLQEQQSPEVVTQAITQAITHHHLHE